MSSTDILINNRFRLEAKISAGSFGTVYRGLDIHTGDRVAIKIEQSSAPTPQLSYEFRIYEALQQTENPEARIGIPRVHWYGREGSYYVLIIDLLGCSLEDLFNLCNRKFSLKTTLMLADQMISRIQYMHNKGYIHRDIKPDNFVIGRDEFHNCVYSIDFGLAKRYRDPNTLKHIPFTNNRSLIGTARYASVHSHIGVEQSRRDDLEAIGYVLVYFLKGVLPWQGLKAPKPQNGKQDRFAGISESKMATSLEQLCIGLPCEFNYYFQHVRSLSFEEKPDYLYLRRLFRELFKRLHYVYDLQYDWSDVLSNSKHGPLIYSSANISLTEQVVTNTDFLFKNQAGGGYDNTGPTDYNSMSYILDMDVLDYYRQKGVTQESKLCPDIPQEYINRIEANIPQPEHPADFDKLLGIDPALILTKGARTQVSLVCKEEANNDNTAVIANGDTTSMATQLDFDIIQQNIHNNNTDSRMYIGFTIDENSNNTGVSRHSPIPAHQSLDVDSWAKQLHYLLDVKIRDQQQRPTKSAAATSDPVTNSTSVSASTDGTNGASDTSASSLISPRHSTSSNRDQASEESRQRDSTGSGNSQTTGDTHCNPDMSQNGTARNDPIFTSIRNPTSLEMIGTIQFAQKQYHTFTLFLQLLCKQLIYVENAIKIVLAKRAAFMGKYQSKLSTLAIEILSDDIETTQLQQHNQQLQQLQQSTQSTTGMATVLPNSPKNNALEVGFPIGDEIAMIYQQQLIVLQHQLQYTRQQQQITMNGLVTLHHYLRCLLLEHQHQAFKLINFNELNKGDPTHEQVQALMSEEIVQGSLQQQRQLLQHHLKSYYLFDYNSLTDQREQVQRLYLQLKQIQTLKEEALFQYLFVLRDKYLITSSPLKSEVEKSTMNFNYVYPGIRNHPDDVIQSCNSQQQPQNNTPLQPNPIITIGGFTTPFELQSKLGVCNPNYIGDFPSNSNDIDITLTHLGDSLKLHNRLILSQDNEEEYRNDQLDYIKLKEETGEMLNILKQHHVLLEDLNNKNKKIYKTLEQEERTKHPESPKLKSDDNGNNVEGVVTERQFIPIDTIENYFEKKDEIASSAPKKNPSGFTVNRKKIVRKTATNSLSVTAGPTAPDLTIQTAKANAALNFPLTTPSFPANNTTVSLATNANIITPVDPQYPATPTDIGANALHPGTRAAMLNISALHFTDEEIRRIEFLPRLRDYGFSAAINTLLQLEFENPNLIHMYILYRKYLTSRHKHPRHHPMVTSSRVSFDLATSNDINNITSVLKLMMFFVKTLPNNTITQNIASELDSLLSLDAQSQLIPHLQSNSIYPRIFDELVLNNPSFISELVNLGYDGYSKNKIVSILRAAQVPLPHEYDVWGQNNANDAIPQKYVSQNETQRLPFPMDTLNQEIQQDLGIVLNENATYPNDVIKKVRDFVQQTIPPTFDVNHGLDTNGSDPVVKIQHLQTLFLSIFPPNNLDRNDFNQSNGKTALLFENNSQIDPVRSLNPLSRLYVTDDNKQIQIMDEAEYLCNPTAQQ